MQPGPLSRTKILRLSGLVTVALALTTSCCLASPSEDKRALGDKLLAAGDASTALHFYDQSITLNNSNWKAYVHRGDALMKMGEAHWASEDWKKALQVYPGCPEALARLHRSGRRTGSKHH